MYRFRKSYWSLSGIANKILTYYNIPIMKAATLEEWDEYEKTYASHKAYKFVKGFNKLQNIIYFPLDVYENIRIYIRNRFITQTHVLKTNLKKGEWHEFDTRLLHGLFNEFIDFIEIEKASMNWTYKEKLPKKKWYHKWFENRNPEAGIDYLFWEIKECDEHQSESAKIQLELYNWWKFERPFRPDPYEESGWSEYCKTKESNIPNKKGKEFLDKLYQIEKEYEDQDEEMLIKLIKIRKHIWT